MSDSDHTDQERRVRQTPEGQRDEDGTADSGASDRDSTDTATDTEPRPESGEESGSTGTPATDVIENVTETTASVPNVEEMEAAMERTIERAETVEPDTGDEAPSDTAEPTPGEATQPADFAEKTAAREAETRVLEFTLAGERYCLDIEYIEEIVKQETITRVPNTPAFVEGVVDLRGQITTILNPKVAIGKDDTSAGDLIVVFDAGAFDDQGAIGWVVDDVRRVSPVSDDQVNDPPMGEDYINGVIDRDEDGEFVIWTTPDLALDEAE